jgi:hypothetical protein
MEMIINPYASEKMAKGGLDIGGLAVVDGVYAERRLTLVLRFIYYGTRVRLFILASCWL